MGEIQGQFARCISTALIHNVAALKVHVRDVRDVAVLKVIYKMYAMLLAECIEELSVLPLVIIIALLLFL